ncbi:MAG TPA: cupin domain-containing protein [Rhizomicrobium sp.]|nr:cupin domain-containing protein [Rhizomicrobium sp.]
MTTGADDLIKLLKMRRHPEGGHYREVFRDNRAGGRGRAHSTAIYFLLKKGERSHWHRIDAAEVWHFYRGSPLELSIAPLRGPAKTHVLGNRIEKGERPQLIVPPHAWQAARSLGAYTLVGCTVAPGFDFATFELAAPDFEPG